MNDIFKKAEDIIKLYDNKNINIIITIESTDKELDCRLETTVSNKSKLQLILKDAGSNKLSVVKLIKEITNLGLKDSKDIVDFTEINKHANIYSTILICDDELTAKTYIKEFEEIGAIVELI